MTIAVTEGVIRDCACLRARHAHGTRDAYLRDLCRCAACRKANADHQRAATRRRAHMAWSGETMWVSPLGTRRRLQALAALGWSLGEIGRRMGCTVEAVMHLRTWDGRMLAQTAAKVSAIYEELSHQVPSGRYATRARNHAKRRGWAPPLAWDEGEIDDPDARPHADVRDPNRTFRAVNVEDVEFLATVAGLSAPLIAHRLGVSACTIEAECRRVGRVDLWLSLPARNDRRLNGATA